MTTELETTHSSETEPSQPTNGKPRTKQLPHRVTVSRAASPAVLRSQSRSLISSRTIRDASSVALAEDQPKPVSRALIIVHSSCSRAQTARDVEAVINGYIQTGTSVDMADSLQCPCRRTLFCKHWQNDLTGKSAESASCRTILFCRL